MQTCHLLGVGLGLRADSRGGTRLAGPKILPVLIGALNEREVETPQSRRLLSCECGNTSGTAARLQSAPSPSIGGGSNEVSIWGSGNVHPFYRSTFDGSLSGLA